MGTFNMNDADKFGGSGGAGYFSLKNDRDTAKVRFLYETIEDVVGVACHEVTVDGKNRSLNCLRDYGDPIDQCPFCKAGQYQKAKIFVPIYDIAEGKVKVWERGKKFYAQFASVMARAVADGSSICSHIFEIERNGKAGSTQTTYQIYDLGKDGTTIDSLPQVPNPVGTVVLDKSADDMAYYLSNGTFPTDNMDIPMRRPSASVTDDTPSYTRRTPNGNAGVF